MGRMRVMGGGARGGGWVGGGRSHDSDAVWSAPTCTPLRPSSPSAITSVRPIVD